MTTMNPLNGIRPRQPYVMPPEYTNNNYLAGSSDAYSENVHRLQQPESLEFPQNPQFGNEPVFPNGNNMSNISDNDIMINNFDINSSLMNLPTQCINSPVPNNSTVGGGNFTFTSPTQSSVYSPSITSTVNRFMQPRTMSQVFAPTSCLQWQHTVPQRIPWSSCSPIACQPDILQFTGFGSSSPHVTFTNQTVPVCSVPRRVSPVPSCSHPPRRLKRQAPDTLSNPPFSSKVHLTEDMISKHMKGLQLENAALKSNFENSGFVGNDSQSGGRQWQKFQDLEKRLSISDEEGDTNTDIEEAQPRLHMNEDIAKMVNSEPVIPKEILDKMLDKITNPRMELVLWTPPGGAIKDLIESNNRSSQNTPSNDMDEIQLADITSGQCDQFQSMPAIASDSIEEDVLMDMESTEDYDML